MEKIKDQELDNLQALTAEFNKLKTQLGDLTLQKHGICLRVESLKKEFHTLESQLMDTYGSDSIINMETGEVSKKEPDGSDK